MDEGIPDTRTWHGLGIDGRNAYRVSDECVDMRRPRSPGRDAQLQAKPQNLLLDTQKAALIVIDMQNDFCAPNGWIGSLGIDTAPARALSGPINRVTASMRRAAVPVIWLNWGVRPDGKNLSPGTQHPFNPNGRGAGLAGSVVVAGKTHKLLEKDSWGAQLIDELTQDERDIHIDKQRISGFWQTPLDAILRNLAVDTLFFAGVNADHCVLGTLMDANFHGYDTILIEDCTATTSPDFCLQATLHNVRFCFGFTALAEDVLKSLA